MAERICTSTRTVVHPHPVDGDPEHDHSGDHRRQSDDSEHDYGGYAGSENNQDKTGRGYDGIVRHLELPCPLGSP